MSYRNKNNGLVPGARKKTIAEYEASATTIAGCLISHRKDHAVSRHVYQLRHGEINKGLELCHTCDNPRCILDAHHFLGTHKDNMADCAAKGRKKKTPEQIAALPEARRKFLESERGLAWREEHSKRLKGRSTHRRTCGSI